MEMIRYKHNFLAWLMSELKEMLVDDVVIKIVENNYMEWNDGPAKIGGFGENILGCTAWQIQPTVSSYFHPWYATMCITLQYEDD